MSVLGSTRSIRAAVGKLPRTTRMAGLSHDDKVNLITRNLQEVLLPRPDSLPAFLPICASVSAVTLIVCVAFACFVGIHYTGDQ